MICRVEKTKGFTIMSNYHLRDRRLSFKARGILSVVLSLPEGWKFSVEGLTGLSDEDGKASVGTGLKELEELKYLKREQSLNEKGQFSGFEYVFYEFPQEPFTENRFTEKPFTENPFTENPFTENQPQLNTNNKVITKELNTNELNTKEYASTTPACDENALKLQILYLNGKEKCVILASNSQIEALKRDLSADELEHYLSKFLYLKCEGYSYACSDYEYIMRMVEADRKVKKRGDINA